MNIREWLRGEGVQVDNDDTVIPLNAAVGLIKKFTDKMLDNQVEKCAVGAAHHCATIRNFSGRLSDDYKACKSIIRVEVSAKYECDDRP